MTWAIVATTIVVIDILIRIVAVGVIPENRRPSSSIAWLLLILALPALGVIIYSLIGSPYVTGRRRRIQDEATAVITDANAQLPVLPPGASPRPALASIIGMNHRLTGLPCVTGTSQGLLDDTPATYLALAEQVRAARRYVHVQFYIVSWDETTAPFFDALVEAVQRGVTVRLLLDHLGSRKYPHWKELQRKLTAVGIQWHLMMPILPLKGRWRRPDLRNHRKICIFDGRVGFMGSHNLIDASYDKPKNKKMGRAWRDLSVLVTGDVVTQLEAVFEIDWFSETGERLREAAGLLAEDVEEMPHVEGRPDADSAMQVLPSGPGFVTEPNLRMFTGLLHMAQWRVAICSPYFVPDESLLAALTSAVYRGVDVDLFVGEEADQFFVGHAQRSYYLALLEAGVRIWLYPRPAVLHAKFVTVDGQAAVIGSSNMDMRSFQLDYEVSLLAFGGSAVSDLDAKADEYRRSSRELTLAEWRGQGWPSRYVDNVCRLVSALM